jgi:hypothetical protein
VFGNIGIHIATLPFFIHESGNTITLEKMHSPSYKPCLAVNAVGEKQFYVYNITDDTLKRFKAPNKYSIMNINKYYKLVNWMVENLPWRNPLIL